MTLGERDPNGISRFDYVPSAPIEAHFRSPATAPTGPSIHLREPFSQVFLLSQSQVRWQSLLRSPFRAPDSLGILPETLFVERIPIFPKYLVRNIEFPTFPPPDASSLHSFRSIPSCLIHLSPALIALPETPLCPPITGTSSSFLYQAV